MTVDVGFVVDPAIHHGKPVVHGTRIPVTIVVGSLAGGMTFDDIQREYDLARPYEPSLRSSTLLQTSGIPMPVASCRE
jgi:hypothetical protein